MKYSEIVLTITPDEAADILSTSISGIRQTQEGDSYIYKMNSGTTLAILKPAHDRKGEAVLRYRTTMISPMLATARRKAREIKDALSTYSV